MKKLGLLTLLTISLVSGMLERSRAIAQDVRQPQCNPPDVFNGFGRCNYGEGHSYYGYFQNGLANGIGTLLVEEARYDGEFVNGLPEGDGRLILPDDSRFEGEFQNGGIIRGAAFYSNGDRYEGTFTQLSLINSQPDGRGQYIFANGNRFEGEFFAGEPLGLGKFTHTTGTVCEGYFFTRNFDGRNCTCTYRNGDRYEGELRQARPHGTGTMIKANGTRISGAFRDGQPVSYSGYGN